MTVNVVGIDPGPCTGLVVLSWAEPLRLPVWPPLVRAYQCNAGVACELLYWLLQHLGPVTAPGQNRTGVYSQIEHFVARGSNLPPSPVTVRMETELAGVAEACGVHLARHPMADVKPWASVKRMKESGLAAEIPAKMLDAYAAGRHAMLCATRDAGIPDPLSKGARAA